MCHLFGWGQWKLRQTGVFCLCSRWSGMYGLVGCGNSQQFLSACNYSPNSGDARVQPSINSSHLHDTVFDANSYSMYLPLRDYDQSYEPQFSSATAVSAECMVLSFCGSGMSNTEARRHICITQRFAPYRDIVATTAQYLSTPHAVA